VLKPFLLLVTDGTKVFSQEVPSVSIINLFVVHITSHTFINLLKITHYFTVVFCLLISPKGFSNSSEWLTRNFSHLINLIIKFLIVYQLPYWGTYKNPVLNFSITYPRKDILGTETPYHFDSPPWRNFLSALVWCAKRWVNLFRISQWRLFPGISECLFGSCFYLMIFPICCSTHTKTSVLIISKLQAK